MSFNPRAREGRDLTSHNKMLLVVVSIHAPVKGATPNDARRRTTRGFNPRAREGRDTCKWCLSQGVRCFNPRAREGRDKEIIDKYWCYVVSIHAPVKGATM